MIKQTGQRKTSEISFKMILNNFISNWKSLFPINLRKVIILILLLIFVIEILTDFIRTETDIGINDKYDFVILSLLFFYLSFKQQINNLKFLDPFKRFFGPFIRKDKLLSFMWFLLLPIAAIFFHHFILRNLFLGPFQNWDILQEWSFVDITLLWLAIAALFIGAKIYFEIKESKTNTLEDYLRKTIDILSDSKKDDELYIVIPTTFLGEMTDNPLKNNYKNLIKQKANSGVNVTIGIYNFDLSHIRKMINNNNLIKNITKFDNFWNKLINDKNQLLLAFHDSFFKQREDNYFGQKHLDRINYFRRLLNHLIELVNAKNIKIERLKNMTSKNGKNRIESGFFAVANFTSGSYYFGQIEIYNWEEQHFNGTYFQNSHIREQMKRC